MSVNEQVMTPALSKAMAGAFSEIEGASKDKLNPHFKSKYADLGSVVDAIKPALAKHGLFFTQATHVAEDGVCVETIIHHSSGESISCGKLYVPANKRDAQGFGSALTYARRYGLMTAFGVPAEDDDGNAAAASAPRNGNASAPKVASATDEQRDTIAAIAPAAGKTLQDICEAYKIASLKELTEPQATKLIERLRTQKLAEKEPA